MKKVRFPFLLSVFPFTYIVADIESVLYVKGECLFRQETDLSGEIPDDCPTFRARRLNVLRLLRSLYLNIAVLCWVNRHISAAIEPV